MSEGTLSDPRPLGIEADESGSMWIEDGQLTVAQRSPRTFDAVEVLVDAPSDARLTVALAPAGDARARPPVVIPLANVLGDPIGADLDDQGNRLLVRRAPGDTLRVTPADRSLVFAPGQIVRLEVQPFRLPVPPETQVEFTAELVRARGSDVLWSTREELAAGKSKAIALEVPLRSDEGAYELVLRASTSAGPNWSAPLRGSLGWKQTVAERRIQVVAVSSQAPASPEGPEPSLTSVVEIDPANPRWYERFSKLPQLPGLPRLWKGPLGNGNQQAWPHPLGTLARLRPNRAGGDVSWEAYSLPVDRPGRPHVLEVRYPSDIPQTLGISIVEPNAAGVVTPIGLDSGIELSEEVAGDGGRPRWLEHRLIFWPRTRTPMVLITNRRTDAPGVYGRIRVMGGWERLPRAYPVSPDDGPTRALLAYLDRPLFPENFCASESPITVSDRSLDDWATFYEGGTRLTEYLRHVGYGGLVLSVLADGSTIYPSKLVESTPRYDTGDLADVGMDPVRKDVLEMLFRLFDREGLQLVPALELAAPLARLEATIRAGGPEAASLVWIGPEGKPWPQVHAPRRGLAPYYNVLNPLVQDAMLAVVSEVIEGYGRHPAFAGLALQLSGYGYAQLPGPDWGLDDDTIARFQRDTRIDLGATGPERFAERARLLGSTHRAKWLQWRAAELSKFYQRIDRQLKAARPDARLYLAGSDLLAGPDMERELRPLLGRRSTLLDALLRAGIDPEHYQRTDGPVLLRPEPVASLGPKGLQAAHVEAAQMPDADRLFASMPLSGSLSVQQPERLLLPSFDQMSPFRRSHTALFAQPVPADRQNRRRLVHSLAGLDSQVIWDGGWLLPLGGEDAVRDLVAAYRRLPAVRFERLAEAQGRPSLQPVTIRYATHRGQTYVYAVNDSPVPAAVRIALDAPLGCRLEDLSGMRSVRPLTYGQGGCSWSVDLAPYDLVAVRLGSPQVRLTDAEVVLDSGVPAALGERIRGLGARAALLRSPPPWSVLLNPGFDRAVAGDGAIPDWAVSHKKNVAVGLDASQPRSGKQCARLTSEGPIACLVSQPFAAPATGRFSMLVWLRVADASRQPPLRLAVEWDMAGRDYRYAQVGQGAAGQEAVPITTEWAPYIFQVYDLPLDGVAQMRVRFDLMGPGEVWIDDVQVSDLAFSRTELVELSKLITVANSKLERGQVGDCIRILEGYWPRFLETNVPLGTDGLARRPKSDPPPREPERTSNVLDRVKDFVPKPLRF